MSAQPSNPVSGPAPLKVSCTASDCGANLHCFRADRRLKKLNHEGACRSCGAELIDWSRIQGRAIDDVTFTFSQLRLEFIRHHYWHIEFDEKALKTARRKGRAAVYEAAHRRICTSVQKGDNPFDGRQTPLTGNVIFYAQHATASCCRKCIEYWHGIPQGHDLSAAEVAYLHGLVVRYLNERLPEPSGEQNA